jgi:hypothetical protein
MVASAWFGDQVLNLRGGERPRNIAIQEEPQEPQEPQQPQPEARRTLSVVEKTDVEKRWFGLVQSLYSVRHLQHLFYNCGERLKQFPASLREPIKKLNRGG